jgi:hypothetical protein
MQVKNGDGRTDTEMSALTRQGSLGIEKRCQDFPTNPQWPLLRGAFSSTEARQP